MAPMAMVTTLAGTPTPMAAMTMVPNFRSRALLSHLNLNSRGARNHRSSLSGQPEQGADCDAGHENVFFHLLDPWLHAPFLDGLNIVKATENTNHQNVSAFASMDRSPLRHDIAKKRCYTPRAEEKERRSNE
jgi:hypothetical protein